MVYIYGCDVTVVAIVVFFLSLGMIEIAQLYRLAYRIHTHQLENWEKKVW